MTRLSSRWMKAALLGSLWAAVEIVLGSFLHNIGMPLTGTVLSALGVCLMVAGAQLWPERGIIWRAGILCALMKSVSPSAVIIGPMVGITLEALILDGMSRIARGKAIGFVLGGAIATTLPVFQKLIGLVFTYGLDAARLFVALYDFAARSLRITALGPVDLILIWFCLNFLLGAGAAVLGLRAGRLARTTPDPAPVGRTDQTTYSLGAPDPRQRFSLPLLVVHLLAVPLGFLAIRDLSPFVSGAAIILFAVLTFLRYPRIRRRFRRVRPWIEFGAMSALAGVVLGGIAGAGGGEALAGVRIGSQMAMRAVLVVVAFSAISVELRNPVVVHWFLRRGLRQVSSALDVAFQALPAMMRAIGEERSFLRHPMASVARILATARAWLATGSSATRVVVITGAQGSGKTTLLMDVAQELRAAGDTVGGIAAPVVYERDERIGYDAFDLGTSERLPLARRRADPSGITAGPFTFIPAGIAFGEHVLTVARNCDTIALDEVGPLELEGKGWARALESLLDSPPALLILVVRPDLINEVTDRWNLVLAHRWEAGSIDARKAADQVRIFRGM